MWRTFAVRCASVWRTPSDPGVFSVADPGFSSVSDDQRAVFRRGMVQEAKPAFSVPGLEQFSVACVIFGRDRYIQRHRKLPGDPLRLSRIAAFCESICSKKSVSDQSVRLRFGVFHVAPPPFARAANDGQQGIERRYPAGITTDAFVRVIVNTAAQPEIRPGQIVTQVFPPAFAEILRHDDFAGPTIFARQGNVTLEGFGDLCKFLFLIIIGRFPGRETRAAERPGR